jgi:amidase
VISNDDELAFISATEQAALIRGRKLSPVELVELHLRRIERLNPTLNCFVLVTAEEALEQARTAEDAVIHQNELPLFYGVPISIKDILSTAGVRTTRGSRAFVHDVPGTDDNDVARLKAAGFIMLGKTNTPEFALYPWTEPELFGPTRYPWDTSLTPGGSTGGGGAALAAGLCPVSQGTDGGGSIRCPASCNGVFGIKPSRGRVSCAPRFGELIGGLMSSGPLARTVRDAAGVLDVLSGYVTGDPYWAPAPERSFVEEVGRDPGRLCVGMVASSPLGEVHADCVAAVEDAASLLEELGHAVSPFDLELTEGFVRDFQTVWFASLAATQVPDWGKTERKTQEQAELEGVLQAPDYLRAISALQRFSRHLVSLWEDYDLLLTPTLAKPPFRIGTPESFPAAEMVEERFRFSPFTPVFNVSGQPAVSLPLWWSGEGLPIGVQLAGPPAGEAVLIRVSSQLEEARTWQVQRPPVTTSS